MLGKGVSIGPGSVVESAARIGDATRIGAGAIVGEGILVIEGDVELGANPTIDPSALGETRIRRGPNIDNLVHIGHNCDIGEDVVIVAQTGIGGPSTVDRGAVVAGQVEMCT